MGLSQLGSLIEGQVAAWPEAGSSGMASFSYLTVEWQPAGARNRLDHTSLTILQASLGLSHGHSRVLRKAQDQRWHIILDTAS